MSHEHATTPTACDRAAERLAWTREVLGNPSLLLEPASADASFRSYWRTVHGGQSWIVMDSPPALEDPAPWLELGVRLRHVGVHVPAVQAHDLARGLLLIEDLGSRLYLAELDATNADALYGEAMDALLRMQVTIDAGDLPPYDAAFLQRELELMPEWFLTRHLGHELAGEQRALLQAAFDVLLASALEQPSGFVHRDFHSRNLLIVAHSGATAFGAESASNPMLNSPGVIDFQGALHGPLVYDLASLLRDCYIAWSDERIDGWVENYRQRLLHAGLIESRVDAALFRRWFDLIGLQRHVKVLGIFCRLWYRDGKRHYLNDLPLVYRYVIDVASRYPELAGLVALLQRCVGTRDITVPVA